MPNVTTPPSLARAAVWLTAYPFTALGGAVLLALMFPFCHRHDSEWEQVYVSAAAHLCNGSDLYQSGGTYLYPPFMAWTAIPFLALPPLPLRLLWFAVNAISLWTLSRWSWRLAGGGRLEGGPTRDASERFAAVLGCLCAVSYVQNCLAHQQTDVVIGAILAGGCLLHVRGRPLAAATAFGIAAACKCTALLWAPYLLWRGRPLAALWVFAVAVSVNLLPDLVHPSPRGGTWLQDYVAGYLQPMTASDHYVGSWGSDAVYNQSLMGLGKRWCTTTWNWLPADCTVEPRPPLFSPQMLRWGMYFIELSLVAVVLWICRPPFRKLRDEAEPGRLALECSTVLLLTLLLSPMSSKAHFGTLLVPAFCLARAALHSRGWLLKGTLAAAVLLGLLCNKDPLGERLYTLSLWYGLVTWQTLLLLAACLLLCHSTRPAAGGAMPNVGLTPFSDRKRAYRATA